MNYEMLGPPPEESVLQDSVTKPVDQDASVNVVASDALGADIASPAQLPTDQEERQVLQAMTAEMQAAPDEQTSAEIFARIFTRLSPRLGRIGVVRSLSPEDREDILQATFIKGWRGLGRFDGANISAWLTTIASNNAIDLHRAKKAKPADMITEDNAREIEARNTAPSAEEQHMARPVGTVTEILSLLDDEPYSELWKDVLYHIDVLDISYEDYAALRGISKGTVKSRLSRARARIRANLTDNPQTATQANEKS